MLLHRDNLFFSAHPSAALKNIITIAYLIAGKLNFNTVPRLAGLPT